MILARRTPSLLSFAALAGAMLIAEFAIVHSRTFAANPRILSLAVTADLALLLPVFYYLLAVRRAGLPALTVAPVFLLSAGAASYLLPEAQHGWLEIVHYLTIPAEALLLAYTVRRLRRARNAYIGVAGSDMFDRLRHVLRSVAGTGWAAEVLTYEFAVWYYALGSWRIRSAGTGGLPAFTYHRRVAYGAIVGAMVVATAAESIAVHFLVAPHSAIIAWALTISSLYLVLLFVADYRASVLRPIVLDEGHLILRAGIRRSARLPLNAIIGIESVKRGHRVEDVKDMVSFALIGEPRLILRLARPIEVKGLLGVRRIAGSIGLAVDDEHAFTQSLREVIERNGNA